MEPKIEPLIDPIIEITTDRLGFVSKKRTVTNCHGEVLTLPKHEDAGKNEAYMQAFDDLESGAKGRVRVPCPNEYCHDMISTDNIIELIHIASGKIPCAYCQVNKKPRALALYEKYCPGIFRRKGPLRTDPSRFPAQWSQISGWFNSYLATYPKGDSIYIYGKTGCCKSRMLFFALGRSIKERSINYLLFRGGELNTAFRRANSAAYNTGKNPNAVNDLIQSLRDAELLIFDDFAQDNFTENMLGELWGAIDYRTSEEKPTIFLSNYAPQDLQKKYKNFLSMDSLVRRIEEFSITIRIQ